MPVYKIHLRRRSSIQPDDLGIEFPNLEAAYLDVCRLIPDTARDMLIDGCDPMSAGYVICDSTGEQLLDVPFEEVLSPREWRLRHGQARPSAAFDRP